MTSSAEKITLIPFYNATKDNWSSEWFSLLQKFICLIREFLNQPIQHVKLIFCRRSPHLRNEFNCFGPIKCEV